MAIPAQQQQALTVEYVDVPDISDHPRNADTREATRREVARLNDMLRAKPEWAAPDLVDVGPRMALRLNNPAAHVAFETRPSLRVWREQLVPSALALTALYEAESWHLPGGEPIDPMTRALFIHSLDAIGIRSRAHLMSEIAAKYTARSGTTRWTSIACGAAIPVLDAITAQMPSGGIDLKLLDIDARALRHAREKAVARGLAEGRHFELVSADIIKGLIVSDALVHGLGSGSQDLVDMLGIFEYIDTDFNGFPSAAAFLRNAFRLVKPGGALVAANMLDTHPQLDFTMRGIGWPRIHARSLQQLHAIIVDAGIDPDWVTTKVAGDGVYAVFEIRKPASGDGGESIAA